MPGDDSGSFPAPFSTRNAFRAGPYPADLHTFIFRYGQCTSLEFPRGHCIAVHAHHQLSQGGPQLSRGCTCLDCVFCISCEEVQGNRSVSWSSIGSHSFGRFFVPFRTWQYLPLLGIGHAEKFHQALLFGGQHHGVRCGDPSWQRRLPVLCPITLQVGPCSSAPEGHLSCRDPTRLIGGAITPASALPRARQRSRGVQFLPGPPGDRDLPR